MWRRAAGLSPLARLLPRPAPLATAVRLLSSAPPRGGGGPPGGRRGQTLSPQEAKLQADMEELIGHMEDRLNYGNDPKLRGPPPPTPTHIAETWAPSALVSPLPAENALTFRTRFYIDSTGQQQFHSVKVQMNVNIKKLGLEPAEEARLVAVARPHYRSKAHELLMSCSRYLEVPRNKAHLRQTVGKLLADARANAAAHAATPEDELPLAVRSQPWIAGDRRAFRRRPPLFHRPRKKSPG